MARMGTRTYYAKAWPRVTHKRLDCPLGKPQNPHVRISATSRHAGFGSPLVRAKRTSHETARVMERTQFITRVMCMTNSASTGQMRWEPFEVGSAAPKAIRSYHFKIQVLQSEGAEKVRTWQLYRSFLLASPPFQSQVDQTFADEAFPFWCWGTCHGLVSWILVSFVGSRLVGSS